MISELWAYLVLQVLLFLITRLYQKRYNKNIGVCLIKIAFIAQLIVYVLFQRHQTLTGNANAPVSLLHNLFILLGLTGLCSLLTLSQLVMILTKILTCDRLKTRLCLRSARSPVNITDLALLIAMIFGPCSLVYLIFNDMSVAETDPGRKSLCSLPSPVRKVSVYAMAAIWIASTFRLLLTTFSSRFINKMITFNEANDVGDEYTRSLIMALYCKEYLRF